MATNVRSVAMDKKRFNRAMLCAGLPLGCDARWPLLCWLD